MELDELISLRPVPCAGVLISVTNRCPLSCAHCSSTSMRSGREPDAAQLARFVGSFRRGPAPRVLMLTGGEPLLRPGLVAALARSARRAATRSAVLTGAFFAVHDRVPAAIQDAIDAVDHFSVSIDAFHEREVPRERVFRLLRRVLEGGTAASVHALGSGPDDTYLDDLADEVRREFGDAMPILASTVRPVGRAAAWASAGPSVPRPRVLPCAMAAWPVVAPDGTVLACCNQVAVDRRPVPAHLRLGDIATDDWERIEAASLGSPMLRMIRTAGPEYLADRVGTAGTASGYCATCRGLDAAELADDGAVRLAAGPTGRLLDLEAARMQVEAGPEDFLRRHASARHAPLVLPRAR
jgi:pyruvate-formate lyase-activating enzyme